jgi:hypothetical protein
MSFMLRTRRTLAHLTMSVLLTEQDEASPQSLPNKTAREKDGTTLSLFTSSNV